MSRGNLPSIENVSPVEGVFVWPRPHRRRCLLASLITAPQTPIVPRTGLAWGMAALLVCVVWSSAQAALTADQGRCQRAVAGGAEQYFNSAAKTLARCHDAIGKGKLPAATDCRLETSSAAKLTKAAEKLDAKIGKRCPDQIVTTLRYGDVCDGAGTAAGLATCLRSDHDDAADALLATLYATAGEISVAARKCQSTASKRARGFAKHRTKALRACRNRAAKDKLLPGTLCADDPATVAKMAKKRGPLEEKVAAACAAGPLAELGFGKPCEASADGATLADCLLVRAEATGDRISLAVYGDGGFCGDAHQGVDGRVDQLLAEMTLEEKLAQMHGSSVLPQGGLWRTPDNSRLSVPGLRMLDGPRGVSKIAGNATAFPVPIARGASWNPELEERIGEAAGREARAKGASVLLAPVTAVIRHPRWGRAQESYGEDPLHLGRMGTAFVRGAQRHVIASAKHFALNSIEDTRLTVSANVDERTLREIYLPHFRMVVEDGNAASVMTAYNRVNGQYCSENPHLLRDILKGDWKFRGFVESDWILGVQSTVGAALGGLDIEMPFAQFYGSALATAVAQNDVPIATIDEAVGRIVRVKLCFRLDTDPPTADAAAVETAEHVALALEAARAGIVLLENAGGVLPLDRGALTTIAVVGPLADAENIGDDGSSDVTPSSVVTILEGLQNRAGPVTITHVTDPASPAGQIDIATAGAAIVAVGFTALDEGEQGSAGDRPTYALPPDQEQLVADVAALNPATVVVLEGGSAIGVEAWVDDVEALLMAWYPGMEGGNAVADVVFGEVNPSGKLPLVVAELESDLPPFINDQDDVTYDYYHGYRLLDRDGLDPRYPFGYGLSYTTYAYSDLVVEEAVLAPADTLRVRVDVTNAGPTAGEEVVQLYTSYVASAVDRPALDLRGFARVALEPGETRTVELETPVESLAYYDVAGSQWVVENIEYGVHVGPHSRSLPMTGSFSVAD